MKKGLTEIIFIIDASGSMYSLRDDTIGGFNQMIEDQKKEEGEAIITTVLFNSSVNVVHKRLNIKDVPAMSEKTYTPRGTTALLDAVGTTIGDIKAAQDKMDDSKKPENTMVVITTDGMENASKEYKQPQIKEMLEDYQKNYGWKFVFIGANIDSVKTAENMGVVRGMSANYVPDKEGTETLYGTVSKAVTSVRKTSSLDASWSEAIDNDYNKRSKK